MYKNDFSNAGIAIEEVEVKLKTTTDNTIDMPVVGQIMTNTMKENTLPRMIIYSFIPTCPKCNHSTDIHKGLNNRCLICGCRKYMG